MRNILLRILIAVLVLAPFGFAARAQPPASPVASDPRLWTSLADLLRVIEPAAYASAPARQRAADAVNMTDLRRELDWSGEKGILIQIRIQVPDAAPGPARPLGNPVLIGVGQDALDAAVAEPDRPGVVRPPPDPGMRERFFFVWVSKRQTALGPRLRFARFTEKESAGIRDDADAIGADPSRDAALRSDRTIRIMRGLRATLSSRLDGSDGALLDASISAYIDARGKLVQGRLDQILWSERKRAAEQAIQRVGAYQNVLTLPALRIQASASAWPALRTVIGQAQSPSALLAALEGMRNSLAANLAAQDLVRLEQTELDTYAGFREGLPSLSSTEQRTVENLLPPRR
jgi:hypothetical protein